MKKIVFAILLGLLSKLAFACDLRVRVTDYPPSIYQDENDHWIGFAVELLELILRRAECRYDYHKMPWKRALHQMSIGEVDVMMNITKTPERSGFMHMLGPQSDETMVLVVPKDSNFSVTKFDDFKNINGHFGKERGTYYGKAFEDKTQSDLEFSKKFKSIAKDSANFKLLARGRISGFVADRYTSIYRIRTNPDNQNMMIHPFVISKNWVYFGLSKKTVSKTLFTKLQDSYDKVKASGEYSAILKKYQQ